MNIVLLGFMGTGKTAVGRLLAGRLKMQYVDMDEEIEKEQKMKISRIFSEMGEEQFRFLERDMVLKVSQRDNQVISGGGGVVLNPENLKDLEKGGMLFCLEAQPEVIYHRTGRHTHRPLLRTAEPQKAIRELLKKRENDYKRIKRHIDTSSLTPEETAQKIIEIFKGCNDKD